MTNDYDFSKMNLKEFLKFIITNTSYKNNEIIKYLIFDFFETYFRDINLNFSSNIYHKYTYFLKRISDTKKFNLDEESLFHEFEKKILNG
jgi:DNA polymerase-3 subunit delta'